MIIYRLVRTLYKDDLSGQGAFLYGGRWNSKGIYALYCSEHISLAALEIIVNYDRSLIQMIPSYHLIEIDIPDGMIMEIDILALKENWGTDFEYSQYIGDQFLQSKAELALKIPSAVIPEESNFLINPAHEHFKKMVVKSAREYGLDNRLF